MWKILKKCGNIWPNFKKILKNVGTFVKLRSTGPLTRLTYLTCFMSETRLFLRYARGTRCEDNINVHLEGKKKSTLKLS